MFDVMEQLGIHVILKVCNNEVLILVTLALPSHLLFGTLICLFLVFVQMVNCTF